jgi:hypothetical protein
MMGVGGREEGVVGTVIAAMSAKPRTGLLSPVPVMSMLSML